MKRKKTERFGVLTMILALALLPVAAGCATSRFRAGPLGAGLATTAEGPGAEWALSDSSGTAIASGSLSLNLPGPFRDGWMGLRSILPSLALILGGSAPVPTGPSEEVAPAPPTGT